MTQGYGPGYGTEPSEAEPPGTGRRFLPFAASVLVVVPLLAISGPSVYDDMRHRIDDKRYDKKLEPLRRSVAGMRPPTASTPCGYSSADLRAWGQFCWNQRADLADAENFLRAALTSIGGTHVETRCVASSAGDSACVVFANLNGGVPFAANISSSASDAATVLRVSGGLDAGTGSRVLFQRTLPGDQPPPEPGWWSWEAPPS